MLDESLIRNTISAGSLTKMTIRRLGMMIESAGQGGADVVLVTCSSIGEAVVAARTQFDFPILRVDEPMASAAIQMGARIGVAATLRTTLNPTIRLLEQTARSAGREIEIVPSLVEGAFEALIGGDAARHDQLLSDALVKLMTDVDVVVLAQASMARIAAQIEKPGGTPILSSPELAVRRARDLLIPDTATAIG
jgi:Asp/Glu/hydantoin racemase